MDSTAAISIPIPTRGRDDAPSSVLSSPIATPTPPLPTTLAQNKDDGAFPHAPEPKQATIQRKNHNPNQYLLRPPGGIPEVPGENDEHSDLYSLAPGYKAHQKTHSLGFYPEDLLSCLPGPTIHGLENPRNHQSVQQDMPETQLSSHNRSSKASDYSRDSGYSSYTSGSRNSNHSLASYPGPSAIYGRRMDDGSHQYIGSKSIPVRFECDFVGCGKKFVEKYDAKRHAQICAHRNMLPEEWYQCTSPDCKDKDRIWVRRDRFQQHVHEWHEGEGEVIFIRKSHSSRKKREQRSLSANHFITFVEDDLGHILRLPEKSEHLQVSTTSHDSWRGDALHQQSSVQRSVSVSQELATITKQSYPSSDSQDLKTSLETIFGSVLGELKGLLLQELLDSALRQANNSTSSSTSPHSSESPLGTATGASDLLSRANQHSSTQKRRRGGNGGPGDEDDGTDEEEDDKPKKRNFQHKLPCRRLKCPFYQRQPEKHSRAACRGEGFADMAKLKDHIKRVHTQPLRCPRCWKDMLDEDSREKHLQQGNICDVVDEPKDDRLRPQLLKRLDFKKAPYAHAPNAEEKWKLLYATLFPKDKDVPSAFDQNGFNPRLEKCLADALEEEIERELAPTLTPMLRKLKERIPNIIESCRAKLMETRAEEGESVTVTLSNVASYTGHTRSGNTSLSQIDKSDHGGSMTGARYSRTSSPCSSGSSGVSSSTHNVTPNSSVDLDLSQLVSSGHIANAMMNEHPRIQRHSADLSMLRSATQRTSHYDPTNAFAKFGRNQSQRRSNLMVAPQTREASKSANTTELEAMKILSSGTSREEVTHEEGHDSRLNSTLGNTSPNTEKPLPCIPSDVLWNTALQADDDVLPDFSSSCFDYDSLLDIDPTIDFGQGYDFPSMESWG